MPDAYVLGLGKSGFYAARLLKAKGWQVRVSDRGSSSELAQRREQLLAEGIQVELGNNFSFDQIGVHTDLLVVSPGIPWDHPVLNRARELGVETIGEVELAWRYLNQYPWVGITGTNGKTTTTALTAAIFQGAGLNAPACGNIGKAICELADDLVTTPGSSFDWIVAELSSYQIESAPSVQPQIGIWTTFTPDHLNRHYTIDTYSNIKASLLRHSQQVVLNGDDPYLAEMGRSFFSNAIWTSCNGKIPEASERGAFIDGDWVIFAGVPVLQLSKFKLLGEHNKQNLLMAVAASKLAGIDSASIARSVSEFKGVPHRLEHICNYQGIQLINDSKATNYDAAEVGLKSVESPAILIAGGESKQGDAMAWLNTIQQKAAYTLLIGQAADEFAHLFDDVGYTSYKDMETLDAAVPKAIDLAQKLNATAVLFSPACASFDQYANFEQRGEHFRSLSLAICEASADRKV
jgi:UDP-N-acetylmuramoylalanine--D-glutamate ligase